MTFVQFLDYASGPGVNFVVGILLSFLIEYVPRYCYLPPKHKRLVFCGLCFLIPVLAAMFKGLCGYVDFTWDPVVWNAIVAGAAAISAGTIAHTPKLKSE